MIIITRLVSRSIINSSNWKVPSFFFLFIDRKISKNSDSNAIKGNSLLRYFHSCRILLHYWAISLNMILGNKGEYINSIKLLPSDDIYLALLLPIHSIQFYFVLGPLQETPPFFIHRRILAIRHQSIQMSFNAAGKDSPSSERIYYEQEIRSK